MDALPVAVLDDPLSAVDAHVGKHLFRRVISAGGMLGGTTRILVSHQTQYLPLADHVVILDSGRVLAQGTYAELLQSGADLSCLGSLDHNVEAEEEEDDEGGADGQATSAPRVVVREKLEPEKTEVDVGNAKKDSTGATIVQVEERATGGVPWTVYFSYMRAMGGPWLVLYAALVCLLLLASASHCTLLATHCCSPGTVRCSRLLHRKGSKHHDRLLAPYVDRS